MAAPGSRVEVEGADTLRATAARAARELDDLDAADARVGQVVRARAVGMAPKLSGRLAQSIRVDTAGVGVSVGSSLIYAGVQENGWAGHNITAQPFMRPALEESAEAITAIYGREVQQAVAKVKGA